MIELKEGWTAAEAKAQFELSMLACEIHQINEELAEALERQAAIREACKHVHVSFAGQEMHCEVCGARIDK